MTNTNGGDFPSQTPRARLDRIESILEKFVEESDKRINKFIEESDKRINSNAKAFEALTTKSTENEQRASRDRSRLYESMARLASAQADFYSAQADMYQRLNTQDELMQTLSRRQGDIVGILKVLSERDSSDA